MPTIPGEVLTTRAGQGSAYLLPSKEPNALAIILQGQRARELDAQKQAAAKQKQAEQIGKAHQEDLKYKTETGRLFQDSFNEQTAGAVDVLTGIKRKEIDGTLNPLEAKRQSAKYLQELDALRIHGQEKQAFWDKQSGLIAHDPTRIYAAYNTALGKTLIGPGGKRVLATAHDAEATAAALENDASTYNESEVVRKTLKDLVPVITQRVAEAGQLGGQHHADQVRGQLLYMQHGKPVLNADGSLRVNLDGGGAALLDQGPVKLLADARETAYNKQREEREAARLTNPTLPALPAISRNGHLSMMFGPQLSYSQSHDEAMNPRPPQPRAAAKPSHDEVTATPAVGFQLSHYEQPAPQPGRLARALGAKPNSPVLTPNNYATVGESFGSARQPYTSVTVDNARAEIIGQDGKPTHRPTTAPNGKVQMQLTSRDYSLYVNGKRLGRNEPFATPTEAYQHLISTIGSLTPEQARKAELRAEYRGALVDKVKTAYDGIGGQPTPTGRNSSGAPTYDNSTTEKRFSVVVPADQYTDAQLLRATGGKWSPRRPTPEQSAVMDALTRKGGRVVNPYSSAPAPAPPKKAGWTPGRGGRVYTPKSGSGGAY